MRSTLSLVSMPYKSSFSLTNTLSIQPTLVVQSILRLIISLSHLKSQCQLTCTMIWAIQFQLSKPIWPESTRLYMIVLTSWSTSRRRPLWHGKLIVCARTLSLGTALAAAQLHLLLWRLLSILRVCPLIAMARLKKPNSAGTLSQDRNMALRFASPLTTASTWKSTLPTPSMRTIGSTIRTGPTESLVWAQPATSGQASSTPIPCLPSTRSN